jgi:hypothetical protein
MATVYCFEIPATFMFKVTAESIHQALNIANGAREVIMAEQDDGFPLYNDESNARVHGDIGVHNERIWLDSCFDKNGDLLLLTEDDVQGEHDPL